MTTAAILGLRCVVLLAVMGAVLVAQEARPQILCLHSYHKGPWTDELMRGYAAGLGDTPHELVSEYLDVKRDQSPEYLALMEQVLARKHQASHFAVVITSDDAAFRFALGLQDRALGGAPLVFCGVNDWDPALIAGHERVTGVVERGDFEPTLELIRRVRPGLRTLHILSDGTATAATNLVELRASAARCLPGAELRVLRGLPLAELRASLATMPRDDAAFFIAWWKDADGRTLLPADLAPALRASAVPVFGRSEWMVGLGEVGGVCITGLAHGRLAGDMARRILAGEKPAAIPVFTGSTNEWVLDWDELNRHRIDAGLFPRDARILNRPEGLWQRHRTAVLAASGAIAVLTILATALAAAMLRERRVRRSLAEREAELQVLFDQSTQLAGRLDPQGRLLNANAVALALAGTDNATLHGRWFWECPWWAHDPALQEQVRHAVSAVAGGATVRFAATHPDRAGQLRHIDFSLKPLRDRHGTVIGLLPEGRDITEQVAFESERRAVETRLRESERLESLGRLAGGVAHDFNNQLTGILGNAELLQLKTTDPTLRQLARAIVTAAQHSAGLTRQMLAFARRGGADLPMDLHRAITETADLLHTALGLRIRLHLSLTAARSTVIADPALIANAVLNLALNARDAMPEGGELRIATTLTETDGRQAIRLIIADTGHGMTPEVQARIFEPFFTTKVPGQGTGLGLAAVHGTVLRFGGTISVDSQPGHGSTFTILLPLAPTEVSKSAPASAATRLSGHVLVVDDEAQIRALVSAILSDAGMTVQNAGGGAEAIALAEAGGAWDLVLLDLLMPGTDGFATFAALRARIPGQRILLVSGFAPEDRLKPLLDADAGGFLAKPFTADELLAAVGEAVRR